MVMRSLYVAIVLGVLAAVPVSAGPPASRPASGADTFTAESPERQALGDSLSRDLAGDVEKQVSVKFTEIQTEHFLIFTDWDRREHPFLKKNLEDAYTAITRQFNLSARDNVYLGHLPVFMFAKKETFGEFTKKVTKLQKIENVQGFFSAMKIPLTDKTLLDFGFLAMWKPAVGQGGVADAKTQWGYVLAHEMTHSFVHRYRGTKPLPTWLDEGIAETVAASLIADRNAIAFAKQKAGDRGTNVQAILKDDGPKDGEAYPIMRTLVEMLASEDKKAFLNLYRSLKEGTEVDQAIKESFHCDYRKLEEAWRTYMGRRTP